MGKFSAFDSITAKSRKYERHEPLELSNSFSFAGSQIFLYKDPKLKTISLYEKLCKEQNVEFIVIQHTFMKNEA